MEQQAIVEKKRGGKERAAKIIKGIFDVILILFAVFAVFSLTISIMSKKGSDGTATVFGTQLRFVQSDSMGKCEETDVSEYEIKSIPVKSCVFVETVPEDEAKKAEWYADIEIGDVLTFKYVYGGKQETITHRVISIQNTVNDNYIFTLEGDNKASGTFALQQVIDTSKEDTSSNYIIGKVTGQSYLLGLCIYAIKTPVGIGLIIILPAVIVIVYNAYLIISVLRKDKKEKIALAGAKQTDEIEMLRKQIEELQKQNATYEAE